MANKGKKISELTALTSASLQTTLVGVDNGTTYKVTLDVLEDAIISMVSRSTDLRLDSLEEYTSSFTQIDIPIGTISSSTQISDLGFISSSHTNIASLNSFTSSQNTLNTAFTTGINARLQTSSFNEFSASIHNEIEAATNEQSFNGLISGSSQLTSSYDERYVLSGSIYADNLNGLVSSSAQITTFGFISSSTDLSSLNQFTQSIDSRVDNLELNSGSYITSLNGTISGSSQLTSSFDTRYALSSSVSSISSSFNSRFNGLVTTGSNTFSGSQIFSGSMTVTSGQVVASTITNNSSSLYLQSGSNLYVQNNGVVEITGSLNVSGSANLNVNSLNINGRSGDEGGEINLAVPETNTTLSTRVVVDIYRDRLRIFDGNTKGVYVDLSKAPTGVSGELMCKASGFVNTDADVTLGNLKARIPSSGNKSLQLSTISGTYSVYGSSTYSYNGIGGVTLSSPMSITTTPTYISAGYNFTVAGSTDTWTIIDTSAGICWRVTMIIGPAYLNNFISIERLH